VSANTTEALSAIYLAKAPVLKSGFYNAFAPGFPSSFTTNDKEYRQKKQILSPAFAPRKLEAMEPLIRHHIETFCRNIAAAGQVDLDAMLGALSMDILSDLCFGKCFDTLNNEKERDLILEGMEKSVQMVLKVSFSRLWPRLTQLNDFKEGTMHRWPKGIWDYIHSKEDVVKRKYVYQVCLYISHNTPLHPIGLAMFSDINWCQTT
jgi:cytochrome P450